MLPTFVIGLREGLEAALIVGIIAAFLRKQGRRDLLRWVYIGVGVAILLCVGVGVALEIVSRDLPQRQQEGLETVVGVLAVVMVTYMVVWMKLNSRGLKGQLEGMAADAMHGGSRAGRAMVLMAFLAVLREGFETVVFLLAAFNESANKATAGGGAALGIVVAVILGYGIYRGGVRLNLSKFFRATGLVLVLVAAGLVVTALHTAHEAGWLNRGQGGTVDLTWLVDPGSVQSSLLTGMLGVQQRPVVIEVVGWLLYLIPVGLFVGWPPGRGLPRSAQLRLLFGAAAAGVVATVLLTALAPSAGSRPPLRATDGATIAQVVRSDGQTQVATVRTAADPTLGTDPTERLTASNAGSATRDGLVTTIFRGSLAGHPAAADSPPRLSAEQVAKLNGGHLPLGLGGAGSGTSWPAIYRDVVRYTLWVEPETGRVIDLQTTQLLSASVRTELGTIPLSEPVRSTTHRLPAAARADAAAAATHDLDNRDHRATLRGTAVIVGIVSVIALLIAVGVLLAGRRRPAAPTKSPGPTPVLVRS